MTYSVLRHCLELTIIQMTIEATLFQQFLMGTLLDDLSVFHYKDQGSVADRRQAVCNNKACTTFHQVIKCFLYLQFGTGIDT